MSDSYYIINLINVMETENRFT